MNLTNKKIESHKIQHRNSSCLLTRSHPPSPALLDSSRNLLQQLKFNPQKVDTARDTQTGMGHGKLRLHGQKKVLTIKS